jgi:hypothetical protein
LAEGLYRAVLEKAYADFRSAETAIDYDSMDPADALERLIAISFDTHRANPHVIRIIMSENLDQGSHLAADDQTVQRAKVLDVTRRILERGIASSVLRRTSTLYTCTCRSARCVSISIRTDTLSARSLRSITKIPLLSKNAGPR